MRIGILWHCIYPWDIRIEKICRTLRRAGNEVVVISRGTASLPVREESEEARVKRLYFRLPVRALSALVSLPLFFNPFWFVGALRVLKREKIEFLVVRDLPLALLGGLAGKILKIPVALDMAENYPAALQTYNRKLYKPFLLGNAWLPRRYEQVSLRLMDFVIVVAEEQEERLKKGGFPPERLFVVRNTPDYEYLMRLSSGTPADIPVDGRYILYSGFMDRHRGIRTLILAFNEIKGRYPDLRLVLIGKGNESAALKKLVEFLRIGERVVFKGWLDFRRIPGYIRNSTLCVIPHLRSEHTDTTVPNKIFDYMYFGKPIVVSDALPLQRIIRELNCGEVFKSGDYRDLRRAIERVLAARYSRRALDRGKQLVEQKYNWGRDGRTLLKVIDSRR